MKIIINGEEIEFIGQANYDEIVRASGKPHRPDYSITVTPPRHKAYILIPGRSCFNLKEGTRFSIFLTGAA